MFTVEVVTKKGTKVSRVNCSNDECYLGKDRENLVMLRGWNIAKQHLKIVQDDGKLYVHALNPKQKFSVHGEMKIKYGPIYPEDLITVGGYHVSVFSDSPMNLVQTELPQKPRKVASVNSQDADFSDVPVESSAEEDMSLEKSTKLATTNNTGVTLYSSFEYAEQKIVFQDLLSRVHNDLIKVIDLRRVNIDQMEDDELKAKTEMWINEVIVTLDEIPAFINVTRLKKQVLNEAIGLGPLEELLEDDEISEIMVNSATDIFYEKAGKLLKSEITFSDDRAVLSAIERIVAPIGRRIDEASPMVDARLKDGSRVNAVIPPVALKGPCITIRKFMKERLEISDLVRFGSLSTAMAEFLQLLVKEKNNIVISGGTGSGKTTLLNVLSNFIPDHERIVTVEDAAELKLHQPNLVSLEARPPNQEGKGEIHIRDLVKNCLRMRPDRIVVGECRGGEALDMLQAMNTGHDGSLTTLHANNPRDCISRLETMVMMSGMDFPVIAIREQICSAVSFTVQQTRFPCGTRKITSITEITGIESGRVQLGEIFRYKQTGYNAEGKVEGYFEATGLIPDLCEKLVQRGVKINIGMFNNGRTT